MEIKTFEDLIFSEEEEEIGGENPGELEEDEDEDKEGVKKETDEDQEAEEEM